MKINVKTQMKDYKGQPIKQGETEEILTLGDVMLTALNFTDKDKKLTPKESISIYRESLRIVDAKESIEFSIDILKIDRKSVV